VKNLKFHKDFTLNGKTFSSSKEILEFSKTFPSSIHSFLTDWFDDKNYVEVKTSGSTGKPKRIQLKKEYMTNSALATGAYFDLQSNTKVLLCLSADYIAGKMMLVRAIVLGWHLDVIKTSSNPLKGIIKTYDFSAMAPMQLQNSITNLDKIKKLIVGGGAVSQELQNNIQNVSTQIYGTYGMTETCTHIAVKELNHFTKSVITSETKQSVDSNEQITSVISQLHNDEERKRHAELVSASHYTLLPNIHISKDKKDCLVIDAPNILDSHIITNDIVELISETEFKWLGRYDTIINSGGVKLIPEQIERKLSAVIGSRFFVSSLPDTIFGEKLILIIDSKKNNNVISSERRNLKFQISNFKPLTKYEIPKNIFYIPQFVETETKKINRIKTLEKLGL